MFGGKTFFALKNLGLKLFWPGRKWVKKKFVKKIVFGAESSHWVEIRWHTKKNQLPRYSGSGLKICTDWMVSGSKPIIQPTQLLTDVWEFD